ncbi:4'-phosphopantetheinyl transferase family protein [Acinetobacter shaoyimingii]|uniref:4'-phosphopantetheinyl transferase superfamily protein n=1 Tax=Acinetobacter shaoyimingii TaxID=2715164 RepID=A0A6G8RYD2_9GAMM|nr:4'-phosphopantetheinyl transferase superfamily protein [Acinetobacter shaoyimingii]QIO06874.1 4'-phosphopantetheinyl transferase superfamily protein [Acinetobacter shaoyimingii]
MERKIRIDIAQLDHIVAPSTSSDRKVQIQLRKESIYLYRNQQLSKRLNTHISNHDFDQTSFGKPFLKSHSAFQFNHSHSQNYYALATSDRVQDLGVDVEDLDRKIRFESLAAHAFHPNELQKWQDLGQDVEYWFKVWTTKEAVLKASGLGIRLSLNTLDTQVDAIQDGGICQHPELGVFAYQNFNLAHCMLTVAWRSELSCKGFAFPRIEVIQH